MSADIVGNLFCIILITNFIRNSGDTNGYFCGFFAFPFTILFYDFFFHLPYMGESWPIEIREQLLIGRNRNLTLLNLSLPAVNCFMYLDSSLKRWVFEE